MITFSYPGLDIVISVKFIWMGHLLRSSHLLITYYKRYKRLCDLTITSIAKLHISDIRHNPAPLCPNLELGLLSWFPWKAVFLLYK